MAQKISAGQIGTGMPVGAGVDFWGTTAPTGWLFAYGQAISRTDYADLFAALGTAHGVGDGSTTFNLPDKRGRSSFGKDDMGGSSANRLTNQSGGFNGDTLGASGGAETHTLITAEIPAHAHAQSTNNLLNNGSTDAAQGAGWYRGASLGGSTQNAGGGGAHNNLPPGIVCNYIIKAV